MQQLKDRTMKKIGVGISLSPSVYERIEKNRGKIKRSTFVEDKLREALGMEAVA